MKNTIIIPIVLLMITACTSKPDKEALKKEVFESEKAFEAMAGEKSIAEAFYFFADENAVIKRRNDTLIIGKQNIREFYDKQKIEGVTLNWTPDFIDVSDDGTLAYSYGKYTWKAKNEKGETEESRGVFHTVWKKQPDGNWKYVWD